MLKPILTLSALLMVTACESAAKAPEPATQAIVESVAAAHPEVVRLTVHAVPAGATEMCAVASTSDRKLGKPSDPEDHRAVATGQTIKLDEPGAVDYTIPVRQQQDGSYTAAVGVTLKSGGDAATQRALAEAIAREVAARMK